MILLPFLALLCAGELLAGVCGIAGAVLIFVNASNPKTQ